MLATLALAFLLRFFEVKAMVAATPELVKFVSRSEGVAFERETVSSGILISCPSWSGPARVRLRELVRVVRSLAPRRAEPLVYVFENDEVEWYERVFGQTLHGHGETFWVRDGRIVHAHFARDPGACDDVEEQTRALLGA